MTDVQKREVDKQRSVLGVARYMLQAQRQQKMLEAVQKAKKPLSNKASLSIFLPKRTE